MGFRVVLLTATGIVTLAKNRPVNILIRKHQLLRKVIHDAHSQVNIQTVSRKDPSTKQNSYLFKIMITNMFSNPTQEIRKLPDNCFNHK